MLGRQTGLLRQLKLAMLIRPCQTALEFERVSECKKQIIPETERKRASGSDVGDLNHKCIYREEKWRMCENERSETSQRIKANASKRVMLGGRGSNLVNNEN